MDRSSIHAWFLLFTALASVAAIAGMFVAGRARQKTSERIRVAEICPLLLIAIVFSLTLNTNGVPLIEWIVPTIAGVVLMTRTSRQRNRLYICCLYSIVSFGLCLHFMGLIESDFTAVPERTLSLARSRQAAVVSQGRQLLSEHLKVGGAVQSGPLAETVKRSIPSATLITVTRTWHSWLTRLYHIERRDVELWVSRPNPTEAFEIELRDRI